MSSSARDIIMATKLKEGLQDTLVYLRLLEGAKLAPVYERKRLQLMNKLLDLEGDTRREAPPKLNSDSEDDDGEELPESPKKGEGDRRNSKVMDIKNKFPQQSTASKTGGYKYKTLEELKREREMKKAGIPIEAEEKQEEEINDIDSKAENDENDATPTHEVADEVEEEKFEEIEDIEEKVEEVIEEVTVDQPQAKQPKKSRSHTLGSGLIGKFKLGKKSKGKGKERSLTVADNDLDTISQTSETVSINEQGTAEEVVVPELTEEEETEGFHLSSQLERVTKRFGKYSYQKVTVTLSNDTVTIMKPKDKEGIHLSLVGAATAIRDSYQFELHTVEKSYTFQTESEDLCIKWVDTLKLAIDAVTPEPVQESIEETIEETPPADVPQITVSNDIPEEPVTETQQEYVNVSYDNKKKKPEMPESSTVQAQSYMFKKGKIGWDRVWVVMTYSNIVFMSANETSKKIIQSVAITTDSKIEKKKGSDKYPHGIVMTSGRVKELIATDSKSDFQNWMAFLERAAGCTEIQELLSEDEDGELYEELETENAPLPPASPRPNVPSFSNSNAPPIEEELYDDFDGDIYEGLDDIDMPQSNPPTSLNNPSLPPRNEPKATPTSAAPPSLPPRNQAVEVAPNLPPRRPPPTVGKGLPMDYEAPSPSITRSSMGAIEPDDEVYDDVLGATQGGVVEDDEELYDDVANTQTKPQIKPQMKSNPKSVQSGSAVKPPLTSKVSTGELYEDMTPLQQQEYVTMEPNTLDEQEEYCDVLMGGEVEVSDELYVDVDTPAPPRPPPPSSSSKIPSRPPPPATVTPTRPAPPKSASLVKQQSDDTQKGPSSAPSSPLVKSSTLPSSTRPLSAGKRVGGTGTSSKVASLSKKFGDTGSSQETTPRNKRGTYSNTIQYIGPGKSKYESKWGVLEGNVIIFYDGPNEKLSSSRLNLKEAELHLGAPDEKSSSQFAFHIKKSSLVHKFSTSTAQELAEWLGPIAKVIQKVSPAPDTLYQAKEDYKGTDDGEMSFKKGNVIWVLHEDTPTKWTGISGTAINSFTGAGGSFPTDKIGQFTQTEDMYI